MTSSSLLRRVAGRAERAHDVSGVPSPESTGSALVRPMRNPLVVALVLALAMAGAVWAAAPGRAASLSVTTRETRTDYYASSMNVADSASRTVFTGWGRAVRGGRYTVSAHRGDAFSVVRHRARVQAATSRVLAASLPSVRSADEMIQLTFALGAARHSAQNVGVALRAHGMTTAYRAAVVVRANGRATLRLSRSVHGHVANLGRSIALPRRVQADRRMILQAAVAGGENPQLAARAWPVGGHQPDWQLRVSDGSNARLRGAGGVAVWTQAYRARGARMMTMTGLRGWRLGHRTVAGESQQPAPQPPAPVSTSPAPVSTSPAPVSTSPAPVSSSPAPVSSSPAPVSSSPAPVSSSPAPVSSSPAPVVSPSRGSLPVGSASYPVPAGAVFVDASAGNDSASGSQSAPLRTIKAALKRMSQGVIVLRAGTYHETVAIAPSQDVTIQAYPGEAVWFDGSVPVTNWVRQGAVWVASGWTATFDHSASFTRGSDAGGFVNPAYPMAAYPDQVFANGSQLRQVAAGTTPGAGEFAVDTSAHTLTVGGDPTGQSMRASDLSQGFVVSGRLSLLGVGVRRYATSLPQIGTLYFGGSVGGSRMQNVVVSDNATQGISIDARNCVLDHVTSTNNGMTGIHANKASGSSVTNSVMTANNSAHFNPAPSAAGIKATNSDGFIIKNNLVSGNHGVNGIWLDVTMSHFAVVGNEVSGNASKYGILTELSDTGIVANNSVSDAQYGYTAFDTGNVQVYNNRFSNNSTWDVGLSQDSRRNSDGATKSAVPWVVRNIVVANNQFGTSGAFQFYALDKATHTAANTMGIVVNGNVFPASASGGPTMVGWGGGDNVTVTRYRTPDALNSGLGTTWNNMAPAATSWTSASAASVSNSAVALPADVADAIGVPAGTRHVGTF